jgi:hypothetical protein
VTLWVLLVAVPIGWLTLGLVVDGSRAMTARATAADVAEQAARAGADAISQASLRNARDPRHIRVDPVAATRQARSVITAPRAGEVSGDVAVNGNDVTVTVHVRRRTAVLSAVGITHISARATATAAVLQGTTNEDAGPSLGRARALVGIADSVPFARRR